MNCAHCKQALSGILPVAWLVFCDAKCKAAWLAARDEHWRLKP